MAGKNRKSGGRYGGDGGSGDWDKLTPVQEALLREAGREVSIVSNGRSETTQMYEVLMRKLLQMAVNGGQHATSNAVYQIINAQRLEQQGIEKRVELGRRIKEHQQHLLNAARKRGDDLNTVLPHPDDIVIEEGVGYDIIGPFDEMELYRVKKNCDWRDTVIMQVALEERLGPLPPSPGRELQKDSADTTAMVVMHIVNDALPQRFRKSSLQIAMELMRYEGVTKRELLKRTHRKWASLGRPKPRGWRMPPIEKLQSAFDRIFPVLLALYREVKAGKLSEDAIASRLMLMIGPAPIG